MQPRCRVSALLGELNPTHIAWDGVSSSHERYLRSKIFSDPKDLDVQV